MPAGADGVVVDDLDNVAVTAVEKESGLRALWRAWRSAEGLPRPPRRVYLVDTDVDVDPVALTGRLQQRLTSAGDFEPQVETYRVGTELPTYQRLAVALGALLWASTPAPHIRIVSIFDEVDPATGRLLADLNERVDDAEEVRLVAEYLDAGQPLLTTIGVTDDVIDPARRNVVPMNLRTDGTWIWADSTTYYLRQHSLAPDPELLDHIRAADYRMPMVDMVAIHRAIAVLQQAVGPEPG